MFQEFLDERLAKQDIELMRYHSLVGYFEVYLMAGIDRLSPVLHNSNTHVYGSFHQLQVWIDKYKGRENIKFIGGIVMKFNDDRPDEILYYATQGME